MAKSAQTTAPRAPRVKLAGTILLLIRLENGRQLRGKLHQLSVTGGLAHFDQPLDEGILVEIIFHVGESTVRTKARTLFPMWATKGYLQPFQFDDLGAENREQLQADLQKLLARSTAAASAPATTALTEDPAPGSDSVPVS
jgi:hypothetical protein